MGKECHMAEFTLEASCMALLNLYQHFWTLDCLKRLLKIAVDSKMRKARESMQGKKPLAWSSALLGGLASKAISSGKAKSKDQKTNEEISSDDEDRQLEDTEIFEKLGQHIETFLEEATKEGSAWSDGLETVTKNMFEAAGWINSLSRGSKNAYDMLKSTTFHNITSTAADICAVMGRTHWAGAGLLVLAAVINKIYNAHSVDKQCLQLLKSINMVVKTLARFTRHTVIPDEMKSTVNEARNLTARSAACCLSIIHSSSLKKFMSSKTNEELVSQCCKQLERLQREITFQVSVISFTERYEVSSVLSRKRKHAEASQIKESPSLGVLDDSTSANDESKHTGIILGKMKKLVRKGKKIQFSQRKGFSGSQREYEEDQDDNDPVHSIIKMLELEEDEAAVAVFLCGDRSTGKSEAGDKVYSTLEKDLKNKKWKQLKIEISGLDSAKEGSISNTDIVPGLRSQILHSLGLRSNSLEIETDKHWKRQLSRAFKLLYTKQSIENVFMYIENVPSAEILGKLLPKSNYRVNRIRLLVTSREKDVIEATKGTSFKHNLYVMRGLGYKQALEFFKKKLFLSDTNKPLVWNVIRICKGYKPQMEIVRDHLVKYYKDEEAFTRLSKWIEMDQRNFEALKEYLDCEKKFLRQSVTTQDALLDICSFFSNWEWDHVVCIFEIDVLEKLKEEGLVKRELNKVVVPDTIKPFCISLAERVRLTKANELHTLLADNKLDAIKGIWLLENKFPFPISAQQLDDMVNLRVLGLGDCTIVNGECKKKFKHLRYFQAGRIEQLPFDIAQMEQLTFLDSNSNNYIETTATNVPTTLRMVKSGALKLEHYSHLHFLPKQCKLIELNLEDNDMENLSLSSAELHAVEKIVLRKCSKLLRLPKSFGNLKSLKILDLSHCEELTELPSNFGWMSNLEKVNFSFCRKLKNLPESINLLTCVNEIDLSYCRSIEKLPNRFFELHTLRVLNFRSCSHLLELPEGYEALTHLEMLNVESCKRLKDLPEKVGQKPLMQKKVSLSWCSSIAEISEGFIRHIKTHVEELNLVDCISLYSLPENNIMELSVLKSLNLSGCRNLVALPKRMNKLQRLEKLNLSSCDKLNESSIRLSRLPALKELIMSNCKVLKGNWLKNLSNIQSLTFVDIHDSPNLENTWNQIKNEIKVFHFTVSMGGPRVMPRSLPSSTSNTSRIEKEIERGTLDFFNNKWYFVDVSGGVFYPSDLEVGSTVAIIFDQNYGEEERQALGRILADLQVTSNSMQVIYIGKFLSSLATELVGRHRVCSGDNYEAQVFFEKLLGMDQSFDHHVMISSEVQGNGELKSFSHWTSISKDSLKAMIGDVPETHYLLLKELSETDQKTNTKLLRALLLTKEINFLITSTAQVEIKDLEGKFVFLLLSWPHNIEAESKAFNEAYEKLKEKLADKVTENRIHLREEPMTFSEVHDKHEKNEDKTIESILDFEVVWIPIIIHGRGTRGSHIEWIKQIKCPSIADPLSISPLAMRFFRRHPSFYKLPLLMAVSPKGKLHSENLIPNTDDEEREIGKKWVTKAVHGREMMQAKMEREITKMRVTKTTNQLFKFMEEWNLENSKKEKEKSNSA